MARKTLKKKLQHKLRIQRQVIGLQHNLLAEEHAKAGLTINYELQAMQSVAMAHGLMVGLTEIKNHFDIDGSANCAAFESYQKLAQGRIAQCIAQLIQMGLSQDKANERIMRGH